jgi:hypothetical protein
MKSSTSWLYEVLKRHPNFDMPLIKELRYFSFLQRQELGKSNDWAFEFFDRKLKEVTDWSDLHQNNWSEDYRRMHLEKIQFLKTNPFCKDWYEGQFLLKGKNLISGDITPDYATLSRKYLEVMKSDYDPRVVLIFRNPLDRLWSALRMKISELQNLNLEDGQKVLGLITSTESQFDLNYREIYENYFNVFGSNLRVYSYEDIHQYPQAFFDDFSTHLDVPKSEIGSASSKIVFPSAKMKMPKWIWEYVVERQLDSRLFMKELFPNQSAGWVCKDLWAR